MNNLMASIKRISKNKNTVTIIGIVVIIGILYFGYNNQIQKNIQPITGIPVAKETIQPRTKITEDMLEYVEVAPIVLSEYVLTMSSQVVGKYSNYNTVIPKGSMFYQGVVVDKLPDSAFVEIKEGQVPYNFPVNMESTYGNSIFPGNKVDIYMKAKKPEEQLMVGKLLENVEVLAVKDGEGRDVFENSDEARTPEYFIFGVSEEIHLLLRKAKYMGEFDVELFPVPHGGKVSTEDLETQVSTQYLKDFINANTVSIPDVPSTDANTETE